MLKKYNLKYNNCQHFSINILNASGLLNPIIKDFTKQETEDNVSASLNDDVNTITDTMRVIRPGVQPVMDAINPFTHTYEYFNPTLTNPFPSQHLELV